MKHVRSTVLCSFALVLSAFPSGAAERKVALRNHISNEIRTATRLGTVAPDERVQMGFVVHLDETLLKQTMEYNKAQYEKEQAFLQVMINGKPESGGPTGKK